MVEKTTPNKSVGPKGAGRKPRPRPSAKPRAKSPPKPAKKAAAGPSEEAALSLLEKRAKTAGALIAAAERALELERRKKDDHDGKSRSASPAAAARRAQRLREDLERRLDRLLAEQSPEGVARVADDTGTGGAAQ